MTDYIAYHEMRAAQERARAAALSPGIARDLHNELADRHADRAWSLTAELDLQEAA